MVTQFAPGTIPVVGRPFGLGKVFYVNHFSPPGDDGNNGIDPLTPFLTITHALTQCVANRNDYIVVLDSWAETTETWPIPVSVDRVHIIGMACPNAPYTKINPGANTTAVFTVTGDYVEIAGFDIGADVDHGGIELDQGRNCWIHHCQFGSVEANQAGLLPNYGIWVHANSNTFCLVEHCRFLGQDGNAGGTIGIDGITTRNAPGPVSFGWSVIRNCVFQGVPSCGIYIHLTNAMVIQDNRFALDADTVGAAITLALLGGVTQGNFVVGNKAAWGPATVAHLTNPYLDENGAGENHWSENHKGNTLIDPA